MKRALAFVLAAASAGCIRHAPPPAPPAAPHYFLGAPYQAEGHWYYPAESYDFDRTGIAEIALPEDGLTADGEVRDPTALTAAMQTVQLPAIAVVTDLENGRQIRVRVNDRGPGNPARLIAVSARAAQLLDFGPTGVARVRVALDTVMSHRVVEQVGGGPKLEVAAAPRAEVTEQSLPSPGSGAGPGPAQSIGAAPTPADTPPVPARLPEQVLLTGAAPGQIYLEAGTFGRFEYANARAARLSGLGADVVRSRTGREESYSVRAGPFSSIPQADGALAQALRAGVPDARLTIE